MPVVAPALAGGAGAAGIDLAIRQRLSELADLPVGQPALPQPQPFQIGTGGQGRDVLNLAVVDVQVHQLRLVGQRGEIVYLPIQEQLHVLQVLKPFQRGDIADLVVRQYQHPQLFEPRQALDAGDVAVPQVQHHQIGAVPKRREGGGGVVVVVDGVQIGGERGGVGAQLVLAEADHPHELDLRVGIEQRAHGVVGQPAAHHRNLFEIGHQPDHRLDLGGVGHGDVVEVQLGVQRGDVPAINREAVHDPPAARVGLQGLKILRGQLNRPGVYVLKVGHVVHEGHVALQIGIRAAGERHGLVLRGHGDPRHRAGEHEPHLRPGVAQRRDGLRIRRRPPQVHGLHVGQQAQRRGDRVRIDVRRALQVDGLGLRVDGLAHQRHRVAEPGVREALAQQRHLLRGGTVGGQVHVLRGAVDVAVPHRDAPGHLAGGVCAAHRGAVVIGEGMVAPHVELPEVLHGQYRREVRHRGVPEVQRRQTGVAVDVHRPGVGDPERFRQRPDRHHRAVREHIPPAQRSRHRQHCADGQHRPVDRRPQPFAPPEQQRQRRKPDRRKSPQHKPQPRRRPHRQRQQHRRHERRRQRQPTPPLERPPLLPAHLLPFSGRLRFRAHAAYLPYFGISCPYYNNTPRGLQGRFEKQG